MTQYRIELRSFNIGAGEGEGTRPGLGFAHNFLVLVMVPPNGEPVPIAQFHGHSFDRTKGKPNRFDATGGGRLEYLETRNAEELRFVWGDSKNHPKFILATGTRQEMEAIWNRARPTGDWINKQDFTYWPLGTNSNSVIYTMARAMGFDITGQPIDPKTGRHIEAPGRSIDLTKGRKDAPAPVTEPKRIFGLGDHDKARERPIPPEQEAPPYDGSELPRRGAVPAESSPASYRLGFENARRFADEHRFDPPAEPMLPSSPFGRGKNRRFLLLSPAQRERRSPRRALRGAGSEGTPRSHRAAAPC